MTRRSAKHDQLLTFLDNLEHARKSTQVQHRATKGICGHVWHLLTGTVRNRSKERGAALFPAWHSARGVGGR